MSFVQSFFHEVWRHAIFCRLLGVRRPVAAFVLNKLNLKALTGQRTQAVERVRRPVCCLAVLQC